MSRSMRRISAILDVKNYKPKVDKYCSACGISCQKERYNKTDYYMTWKGHLNIRIACRGTLFI